jgi:hypothetical protein
VPAILILLAAAAFAAMAVARKKRVRGGGKGTDTMHVTKLLDTADNLLLEGRDDEAADWFNEAHRAFDQLPDDKKKAVEPRFNELRQTFEGNQ